MVDKLCQRFVNTDDQRIWRDIAFCLSLLPFKSEKSYRKLMENMAGYQDKLHEESVHRSFMEIIAKVTLDILYGYLRAVSLFPNGDTIIRDEHKR